MITVRAGSAAIGVCLLLVTAGCSREQQDWRSAEAADSIDSYGQFIQRHPDSELITQARARVAQLGEDRDWQLAGSVDTVDAYREFIAQHPNGKWAQEAHIRIENFSLGEQAGTDAGSKAAAAAPARLSASQSAAVAVTPIAAAPITPAAVARPGVAPMPIAPAPAAVAMASPGRVTSTPRSPAATGSAIAAGAMQPALKESAPAAPAAPAASAAPTAPAAPSVSVAPTAPAPRAARAAPTAPPVSATPNAPGNGGYGIQLGAYSKEASASAQWQSLMAKYPFELQGLQEHVVTADIGSGRIYRLQATVADEGRARAICDSLKKHGQACVTVSRR